MDYEEILEKEEQERNKKKPRKWRTRFWVAVLVLLVAVGSFFGGQAFLIYSSAGSGVGNYRVLSKLMFIEACIDKYFLHEVDEEEMESYIYKGMMNGLHDPYAAYYSREEYQRLLEEDAGEYVGIGVTVREDANTGYIIVDEVNKNGPAYKAGLQVGDIIMAVDGEDTAQLGLQDTVSAIRTKKEPSEITIYREHDSFQVTVEKSEIALESVTWKMMEDGVGYISVAQFVENTFPQFEEALSDLEGKGMKGLVIDLRDNGGGLLNSCIDMVSRILPKDELIVYTEDKEGKRTEYKSISKKTLKTPMVVLVNENTASASEIMTGCLKDYQLATVVGEKTFGKGIVQNVMPFSDGSAIKMTVSKYYTPKGNDIHEVGIAPDVTVEIGDKKWAKVRRNEAKDTQLEKALEVLQDKMK
ncbi:MAG: S41 family peptidase [Eubacteriales bacterium]|nr:S41 family peptidase [Eubacteriales bacterium]